MKRLILFFFLLATMFLSAQVQVNPADVQMTGNIGPQGNFPLLNSGTLNMQSDADWTITPPFPAVSASVLRVTSSVPLTQTRSIVLPTRLGFEFTIQNVTTGGQSIIIKTAAGSGVTIPTGKAMLVMCDGTNYVSVGSGEGAGAGVFEGLGQNVSKWGVKADGKVATCQNEPRGSKIYRCWDQPFWNLVIDFKPSDVGKDIILYGKGPPGDSLAREFVAGSDPAARMYVANNSCGASCTGENGYQSITFTDVDDGCTSVDSDWAHIMPYGVVQVVDGAPTGEVYFPVWRGSGCTKVPTQGQVRTVNGTTTFTGGYLVSKDWPTTITGVYTVNPGTPGDGETIQPCVDNGKTICFSVADTAPVAYGGPVLYGTDDHDAWERACIGANTELGKDPARSLSTGDIWFAGASLTSHEIKCHAAAFHLSGIGWNGVGRGPGSAIIYAGRGKPFNPADPVNSIEAVLHLGEGYNGKLERFSIEGNTMAKPVALMYSTGLLSGSGINQNHVADQLFLGLNPFSLTSTTTVGRTVQSCIFGNSPAEYLTGRASGNNDFHSFYHIYCHNAEIAVDRNDAMATNWYFGQLHSQENNIGFSSTALEYVDDYYTERNRVDVVLGSPTSSGGGWPVFLTMRHWAGESSAQALQESQAANYWGHYGNVDVDTRGLGTPTYYVPTSTLGPTGKWVDISQMRTGSFKMKEWAIQQQSLDAGLGTFNMQNICQSKFDIDLTNIPQRAMRWWTQDNYPCGSQINGWLHIHGAERYYESNVDIERSTAFTQSLTNSGWMRPLTNYQNDNFFQNTWGSILVRSPAAPGETGRFAPTSPVANLTGTVLGTSGGTTYRYQITCVDGQGLEGVPAPQLTSGNPYIISVPNGPPTLSDTGYIRLLWDTRRGCSAYRIYGDRGAGAIGLLKELKIIDGEFQGGWYDTGVGAKGAAPPIMSLSGSVTAERLVARPKTDEGIPFQIYSNDSTRYLQIRVPNGGNPIISSSTGTIDVEGSTGGNTGGGGVTFPQGSGVVVMKQETGGGTTLEEAGRHTDGAGSGTYPSTALYLSEFTPTGTATAIESCMFRAGGAGGTVYCGIYDSNGTDSEGHADAPGTFLCGSQSHTFITLSWNEVIWGTQNCPVLQGGHKYFVSATIPASGTTFTFYNLNVTTGPTIAYYYSPVTTPGTFPATVSQAIPTTYIPAFYVKLHVTTGAYAPQVTHGIGYLHSDGTNYSWEADLTRGGRSAATHPAGSIACFKASGELGSCRTAMTGTPPHCSCQ